MENNKVISAIASELGLDLTQEKKQPGTSVLAGKINDLIENDFGRLISILYRMDVSETKLKQILRDNPGTDAGLIIAGLMIERQEEKIRTRRQFGQPGKDINENEKW